MEVYNYLELAICGIHLGDTKEPTYTVFRPEEERLFINLILSYSETIFFSFCKPSLGPTSTIFTNSPWLDYKVLAYCMRNIEYIERHGGQFLYPGCFIHEKKMRKGIKITNGYIK